jgi:effector-binding domain-containing protein
MFRQVRETEFKLLQCKPAETNAGRSESFMNPYNVQAQQVDGFPLAVVQRKASLSELSRVVPECCGLVWDAVRTHQVKAGRNVAIYWDGSIRLEVGVELHGPFVEVGQVVCSATPAGAVAWVTHLGPYGGLGAAHEAVRRWCSANHRRLAGPNWEVHGHWQTDWNTNPSQIRTDVYYQLAD